MFFALIFALLLAPFLPSSGDVFTAMVDLENMLISEAGTTSNVIEQYIQSEQARLEKLRE